MTTTDNRDLTEIERYLSARVEALQAEISRLRLALELEKAKNLGYELSLPGRAMWPRR